MISFEEAFDMARGKHIKVNLTTTVTLPSKFVSRQLGAAQKFRPSTVTITIGRIEPHYGGKLYYFEPASNIHHPLFIEKDLDKLKEKIKAHKEVSATSS